MQLKLTHSLHRAVAQNPDGVASTFKGRSRTWRELAERVARLAGALKAMGMHPGDRVGMLALNSDRYLEYMLAVWWGGGAINPVNIRWSLDEVVFSLDDCDTKILLVDDHFADWSKGLLARSRSLQKLVFAGEGTPPSGLQHYEQLLSRTDPIADSETGGNSLAGVFYTGGTTGFPKGVMLTHNGLLSNAIGSLLEFNYDTDERILAAAPIFHQGGMCIIIRALVRGCTTIIMEAFDARKMLECIEQKRPSFTLLVPAMLQMLIDHPEFERYDISSLRKIIYGASPIGEGLLKRVLEQLPGVALVQSYGMTEASGPYTVLPAHEHRIDDGIVSPRLRAAGRAIWSMEMRIIDEAGNEVGPGEVGEVISRGAGVMQGYWNRPKETAEALRGGWLYSGDLGYMDGEGYLYLVDRLKDMIVSGGENIYSAEVENALSQHPAVASSAVIGIPSEKWGEAVHAVVVLREGAQATEVELRDHCRALIAGYKCPVSLEFRESLPLTGAGKLQKHVLREPFWRDHKRRVG